jgi:hypothetical protein
LSPGRRTNRENFRSCQRTSLFLLLSFSESIKKAMFYLPLNQSSARRPQAGVASTVQAGNLQDLLLPESAYFPVICFHAVENLPPTHL